MGSGSSYEGPGAEKPENKPHPIYLPKQFPDVSLRPAGTPANCTRTPTDTNCCYIFLVCLVAWVVCVGYALYGVIPDGYQRMNHSFDYQGRLCGVSAGVEDKPYVFFCGSKAKMATDPLYPDHLYFRARTCVAECPVQSGGTVVPAAVECLRPEETRFYERGAAKAANGVQYKKTFEMYVQQSVQLGDTYPTTTYSSYCMPKNEALKLSVYDGPFQDKHWVTKSVAGMAAAWPVLLFTLLLAILMGLLYLWLLDLTIGVTIYGTMLISWIFSGVAGLFFIFALFKNPEDYEDSYCQVNPILHTYQNTEGKLFSIFVGLVFLAWAFFLFVAWKVAIPQIDKSVGIIAAGMECVWQAQLWLDALVWSGIILVECTIFIALFMFVATYGDVDGSNIQINGVEYAGMESKFKWPWYWHIVVCFYILMCWWMFEQTLTRFQFSVLYSIHQWFMVPQEKGPAPAASDGWLLQGDPRRAIVNVNVQGADAAPPGRAGVRVKGKGGQELIVVSVGKKGPGNKDMMELVPADVKMMSQQTMIKKLPFHACYSAMRMSLWEHGGTIARASLWFRITGIIKFVPMCIRAIVPKAGLEGRKNYDKEDETFAGAFKELLILVAGLMEQVLGGMGKNSLSQVLLSSEDFDPATRKSKMILEDAGGVVGFLHGSCGLYEFIAVCFCTSFCGMIANILLKTVCIGSLCFTDPANEMFFVVDTWHMTLLCMVLAALVSYTFISTFALAVDGLLYTFLWMRRMKISSVEMKKMLLPSLLTMLEHEMDDEPSNLGAMNLVGARHADHFSGAHFSHGLSRLTGTAFGTHAIPGMEFGSRGGERTALLGTHPNQN